MLNIQEMEKATALTQYTLRYYEKEGLLIPKRQKNGRRMYTDDDVSWLLFVKDLRSIGITIEELRLYATLKQSDGGREKNIQLLEMYRERLKETVKRYNEVDKVIVKQMQRFKKEQKSKRKNKE